MNASLTQQELTEYDETGFLVRRGLLSDQEIARHGSIPVIGQPGDVIFFSTCTSHMSKANTSDHYRRGLINGYATPGANHRVYPGAGLGRVLRHQDVL